jgi:hypothetical protein
MRACWLAGTRPMAASISTSETVERKTGSRCVSSQCRSPDFCDDAGPRVANKAVSMSQVFNTFLSVDKSLALETQIQMIGEGEQGLAEFPCVRTGFFDRRLLEGANHRNGLAVVSEDGGLTFGGGSGELGDARLGFSNADRLHLFGSRTQGPSSGKRPSGGVTTFCLDRIAGRMPVTRLVEVLAAADAA